MSAQAYSQEEILEAWKTFVAKGIILEDKVRPIVARSWERCRNLGVDPWSSDFPKCSIPLLKKKRSEHAELLSIASPVMKYLLLLLNCNISICDADGFIYELITPLKNYPRTLGTYQREDVCGNGAVTIVLQELVPVATEGFEHYRVISQICSNASSPIILANRFSGVLNAVNPLGSLPNKSLPMIIAAAKVIETLMGSKSQSSYLLNQHTLYQNMIDCCAKQVAILNSNGTILTINNSFNSLLGFSQISSAIGGEPIDKYLVNKIDFSSFTDGQELINSEFEFSGSADKKIACRLIRNGQITLPNGEVKTLLIFDHSNLSIEIKDSCKAVACTNNFKQSKLQNTDYIGESPAWTKVKEIVNKTAPFPSNVLLQGETGTGKEVVANAIHRMSNRKGCFVALNCGSIPKELLHSELFGYEQGAFTGARAQGSIGKFEHAHEGTILLDEISEMPLDMQVSLLRFLQERVVTRISSNKAKKVDVRVIAASNKDMAALVRSGHFREDLYYRLNVIEINLPPLRERRTDIPLLADYFVAELSKQFNVEPRPISQDVIDILTQHDWPGNVRELKNVMEKALVLSEGMEITPDVLPGYILHGLNKNVPQVEKQGEENTIEREHIVQVLETYGGNISKASKDLNMARNTLYRKIEKYNIRLKTSAVGEQAKK